MCEMHSINGIPTRELGSTGVRVTILGIGGYHIGKDNAELGIRIIRTAIDEGINFLDNAWCYNEGNSERIMGCALQDGYRDRVFLMTKNHGRDGATYRKQLEESLDRLQVDQIDLVQFHQIDQASDATRIFSEGAIEAAFRAREEGKIRYIGFTGHTWPAYHLAMLDQTMEWDTVQLPINLLDTQYHSFRHQVLPRLLERGIGVIGMKSLASGNLLETGVSAADAISYSLSQPIDVLVSGIDSVELLHKNLATARAWQPLEERTQQVLIDQTAAQAATGQLEHYKANPAG